MVELLYGAKKWVNIADGEIRQGRPVAVIFHGWRRRFVYRAISMYAEYDRLTPNKGAPRRLGLGVAWRIMVAPQLFGLVLQARESNMTVVARDTGQNLAIRFEPSNPTPHEDARDATGDLDSPDARAGGRER